jgi:hypothetical protein
MGLEEECSTHEGDECMKNVSCKIAVIDLKGHQD